MLVPCLRAAICPHGVKSGREGPEEEFFGALMVEIWTRRAAKQKIGQKTRAPSVQFKKDARHKPFSETLVLKDADTRR